MAINNVINGEAASSVREKINQAINGVNIHNSAGYATLQYITNLIANYFLKTETYSKGEVNNLIANIQGFQLKIISNIGEVVDSKVIYLLPISGKTNNSYSEYLYINGKPELMGEFNTTIDLSNYVTTTQLNNILSSYVSSITFNTAINNLANTYVAKEAGKSLIEDLKVVKLDALPSSVYSQTETQQAINTAIEGVNSAGTRISFVKEYKNGTLEYIGENGVILQNIYSKMMRLEDLPKTLEETKNYLISSEKYIGNDLYIVIDNKIISLINNPITTNYNDRYKFDIINVDDLSYIKVTCLVANTDDLISNVKVSYLKYYGDKVSITIECNSVEDANNLELTIPKLKFNKEILNSLTMDDDHSSDYSVVFALINNRPICYTVGHGYSHEQYMAGDFPTYITNKLGYTMKSSDGCGNERRFRAESSVWTYKNMQITSNVDLGNTSNDWRFNYYLGWTAMKEMRAFGCGASVHNIDKEVLGLSVEGIQAGFDLAILDFINYTGKGIKLSSQPDGTYEYVTAFLTYPQFLLTHDRDAGYTYPFLDSLNLYKKLMYRTVETSPDLYIPKITSEVEKSKEDRIHLYTGCHTATETMFTYLNYLYTNHGTAGDDKLWFCSRDEFYEYWFLRKYSKISKTINGLSVTFDIAIPKGQYFFFRELTFIPSLTNITITSISDNVLGYSINDTTKMFNINVSQEIVDTTEMLVSRYEANTYIYNGITYTKSASLKESEKADALYFANQLRADLKSDFVSRINNVISILLTDIIISGGDSGNRNTTIQLTANLTPINTTQTGIIWTSSNDTLATVNSSGLVTLKEAGNVIITATSAENNTISDTHSITIQDVVVALTSIVITGATSIDENSTTQLGITYNPTNTTQQGVTWASSNNAIATVNSSGLVTAITSGNVVITATSTINGTISDTHNITITEAVTSNVKSKMSLIYLPYEYDAINGFSKVRLSSSSPYPIYDTLGNVFGQSLVTSPTLLNSSNYGTATGDNSGAYPDIYLQHRAIRPGGETIGYFKFSVPSTGTYRVKILINDSVSNIDYANATYKVSNNGVDYILPLSQTSYQNNHSVVDYVDVVVTNINEVVFSMEYSTTTMGIAVNVIELEKIA